MEQNICKTNLALYLRLMCNTHFYNGHLIYVFAIYDYIKDELIFIFEIYLS